MKTNIEIQMNMQPMVMTYTYSLSNYHNTVNQRHPNANNPDKNRRRIQTLAGRGGKGRGGVIGSGRVGREGRGRGYGNFNARCNDEWQFTVINGKMIKVHPSYRFEQDQWLNLPEDVLN